MLERAWEQFLLTAERYAGIRHEELVFLGVAGIIAVIATYLISRIYASRKERAQLRSSARRMRQVV